VLAVFHGPHTYVSATWYTQPQMGSTWNYMSVHAAGTLQFMPKESLITLMKKLTLHFEGNNPTSPTIYNNLPSSYVDTMMPAIVGFEIEITELKHVFKLSQNRDEESYQNIIQKLEATPQKGNAALIADEMKKRQEGLFLKKKV